MAERLTMVDGLMAQRLDGLADSLLSGLTGRWLDGLSVDGSAARRHDGQPLNCLTVDGSTAQQLLMAQRFDCLTPRLLDR
jgi:prepilin-type processing-associated H-X9-DG protein